MTVQEFQAGSIERAAGTLAHFLETTVAERRDWTPTVEGAEGLRSALDQISECIMVNRMVANILRGGEPPTISPLQQQQRPFGDTEEAKEMLIASGKELADTIRAMSDEALTQKFPTRRGPMPGYFLIEMPLRNMNYHGGQINLIQLCYGDTEFRPGPAMVSPPQ